MKLRGLWPEKIYKPPNTIFTSCFPPKPYKVYHTNLNKYHFEVRGSVQTGDFVPASPDGSKSSCPDTGIKYIPKYQPTPTGTTTSGGPSATPTGLPYAGKGYLNGFPSAGTEKKGCLISGGTWYTTGTCATYTATASGMRHNILLCKYDD